MVTQPIFNILCTFLYKDFNTGVPGCQGRRDSVPFILDAVPEFVKVFTGNHRLFMRKIPVHAFPFRKFYYLCSKYAFRPI